MRILKVAVTGVLSVIAAVSCNEFELIQDDQPEATGATLRPATASSKAGCTRVYDYRPAPGQFINDENMGTLKSAEKALRWAEERVTSDRLVSLGAFGGYIVVGFDHSIVATGGYDFAVGGNAFINAGGASNEPGIVWVMQDDNGNGEPDDTWYALKGADWDQVRSVTITYTRPAADCESVPWTTSEGSKGVVEYLPELHKAFALILYLENRKYLFPWNWFMENHFILFMESSFYFSLKTYIDICKFDKTITSSRFHGWLLVKKILHL